MELLKLLNEPGREYTPMPFWFLNGDLTVPEIRRQLTDFAAHGVYGVVLHPRIGLAKRIGYLSRTFFYYIKAAVQCAQELGMKVVLYDEGMYPSGSANGLVVKGHPELASVGLGLVQAEKPGDKVLARTKEGVLVVRPSGGTLRGIHWGEDDGEAHTPHSADILNPDAVARFIHLTHDAYYEVLKEWFGTTIIGFFTDEPSILGRNAEAGLQPWTHGFETLFQEEGGKIENLTALFDKSASANADTALYHALLLKRESEVYYASLSNWCSAHGIALMGHPHQSDDIEVEQYFHIPGQDLVLRWIAPEKSGIEGMDSTMAKCSADAARLMNRSRNANECFGACCKDGNPWQLSGGDIKWYLDWLGVRGVNLFIPHAFYYSIAGKRSGERPPDVGPHSSWWKDYEKWSTYMRRLSALMTDAELYAPVAVLCENRALVPELVAPLYERQTGFQYLPKSVWEECSVKDGALLCRGRSYPVVLNDAENRFAGVSHDAADAAADCICTPPAPYLRSARVNRCGTECWLLVNEGEETIETEVTLPGVQYAGSYDLWNGTAERANVCAGSSRIGAAQATETGKSQNELAETSDFPKNAHREDALAQADGSRFAQKPQSGVSVKLALPKRGSILLFACSEAEWKKLPERAEERLLPQLDWKFVSENAAEIQKTYEAAFVYHKKDAQDSGTEQQADAVQCTAAVHTAERKNGSAAPKPVHQVLVVDGEEMAELSINGKTAGVSFWAPHRFVLDGLAEGVNKLTLTFTGSLANRYGRPVEYGLKQSN